MSSNDNVINFADRRPVELPSDCEAPTDILPAPPHATEEFAARRAQLINYLNEFLTLNANGIDSFVFIAAVQKPGELSSNPVIITSPLSPEREAFFISNLQAIHHQRLQDLWSQQ